MAGPVEAALADPWGTARRLLDEPLHPGGEAATADLLDRAGVGTNTRLVDVGCGAGDAVALAADRGARAVGVDRNPGGGRAIRGDMSRLPIADGAVDVVLAECALCLSPDLDRSLEEVRRVLAPEGRLALSDVVVEEELPDLPEPVERALCLNGSPGREALARRVAAAGFDVRGVCDHRAALLTTRDRLEEAVDYKGLLGLLGGRGERLLSAIEDLEQAVEKGRVGYVSLVAERA